MTIPWYTSCDVYTPATHINSPESHGGDVEGTQPIDRLKTKVLECSIAVEQVLHILLPDANIEEVKLLELREKKGGRDINLGKIAGAEAGAVQCWREAERGWRKRATSSSFKAELLELI